MGYTRLTLVYAVLFAGVLVGIYAGCAPGYISHHGNCYKFYNSHKNWETSRKICQQSGGDLAIIDTVHEAENVKQLRIDTGKDNTYYWIGGRQDPHANSPFHWLNGNSISSHLWFTGEPNQVNGHDKQCVDLGIPAQHLKMNDWPCSEALPFMCEKKCPSGWYDNQYGTCYKFSDSQKNWYHARTSCRRLGGDLAVIDTVAKAEEMKLLRKNTGHHNRYYWVGAIQKHNAKGAFKWINFTRFNTALWYPGEPNQVDNHNRQCIDLGVAGQQFKMNDYPCSSSLYFVCEKGFHH